MSLFEQLLAKGNEIKGNSLAPTSKKTYESCINVYENILTNYVNVEPYPIKEDKIIGFIVYQKDHSNRSYSTIKQYIQAFSSYFKNHNLDNLVLSISLKVFKSGLRREMQGGYFPNAKKPFNPAYFQLIYERFTPTNIPDQKFFFFNNFKLLLFFKNIGGY